VPPAPHCWGASDWCTKPSLAIASRCRARVHCAARPAPAPGRTPHARTRQPRAAASG
jgi:hypothetical protein